MQFLGLSQKSWPDQSVRRRSAGLFVSLEDLLDSIWTFVPVKTSPLRTGNHNEVAMEAFQNMPSKIRLGFELRIETQR